MMRVDCWEARQSSCLESSHSAFAKSNVLREQIRAKQCPVELEPMPHLFQPPLDQHVQVFLSPEVKSKAGKEFRGFLGDASHSECVSSCRANRYVHQGNENQLGS